MGLGPLEMLSIGAPPLGGGPGTIGPTQRRTARTPALVPTASSSPTPGASGGSSAQAKLINNLQEQVYFLELELKYLRETGSGGARAMLDKSTDSPAQQQQARSRRPRRPATPQSQ
jgi:hypothetical protein